MDQLVKRLFQIPEVCSSNPVIGEIFDKLIYCYLVDLTSLLKPVAIIIALSLERIVVAATARLLSFKDSFWVHVIVVVVVLLKVKHFCELVVTFAPPQMMGSLSNPSPPKAA